MTSERRHVRFLASVTTEAEALSVTRAGADIVDCKNPQEGALGALSEARVRAIKDALAADVEVSATIGDLPCDADLVTNAACRMAETGVDYVKVGFFGGGDARAVITALGRAHLGTSRLVAVLLADLDLDTTLLPALADAGFAAVLLDTADKTRGSLFDQMSAHALRQFITDAHKVALDAGLAGSLRLDHVPMLRTLSPDIAGFRGALCRAHDRVAAIDQTAVEAVRAALGPKSRLSQRIGQTRLADRAVEPKR